MKRYIKASDETGFDSIWDAIDALEASLNRCGIFVGDTEADYDGENVDLSIMGDTDIEDPDAIQHAIALAVKPFGHALEFESTGESIRIPITLKSLEELGLDPDDVEEELG